MSKRKSTSFEETHPKRGKPAEEDNVDEVGPSQPLSLQKVTYSHFLEYPHLTGGVA